MSMIKHLVDVAFDKHRIKEPIFLKEFSEDEDNQQLNDLIELSSKLKEGQKKQFVDRDIVFLKKGLDGERNVYFELKNSFLPILCLHDIRLEYDGYVAQFDYIVISNKFVCILETKSLNGNITINQDGDFIRIIKNRYGKEIKKEGMYSPISQNERHLKILDNILRKEGLIKTMPLKSLVVIANPKTIIDKYKCPSKIQKSLYKHDQISSYLENHLNDKSNDKNVLEKYMYEIARYLVENNKPMIIDYYSKYRLTDEDFVVENKSKADVATESPVNVAKPVRDKKAKREELVTKLKKFRYETAQAESLKPYMVFSNAEMEELLDKNPRTKEELLKVKGFGKVKVGKYGDEIFRILKIV